MAFPLHAQWVYPAAAAATAAASFTDIKARVSRLPSLAEDQIGTAETPRLMD